MLDQLQFLRQRISHADLSVQNRLIPNEGGWRGWRVGLGVGVEVFT